MPKASLESVLIVDAGTIGLSIVQALRIVGTGRIAVIELDAAERVLALKLDATEARAPDELTADVRFTGAVDVVAAQATLNDVCTRVYTGGTVVCTGVSGRPCEIPLPMIQRFEYDLLNSGMYIPENLDTVIEWLADGRFGTSKLVADLFTIEDTTAAFERAQQNDSIKVMLQFASE